MPRASFGLKSLVNFIESAVHEDDEQKSMTSKHLEESKVSIRKLDQERISVSSSRLLKDAQNQPQKTIENKLGKSKVP